MEEPYSLLIDGSFNLNTHGLDVPMRYNCPYCDETLATKKTLYKHKKRKHTEQAKAEDTRILPFKCCDCTLRFNVLIELIGHYKLFHGMNLETQQENFNTEREFLDWKAYTEKETNTFFTRHHCGGKGAVRDVKKYYCHRTGRHNRKSTPKEPEDSGSCPAFMRMELYHATGEIRVQYCLQHHGHVLELGSLRRLRKEVAELHLSLETVIAKSESEKFLGELKKYFKAVIATSEKLTDQSSSNT